MSAKSARRYRRLNIINVLWGTGFGIFALTTAVWWLAPMLLIVAAMNAVMLAVNTGTIRRATTEANRPDYSAIARMEREVWGETFTHAGAPAVPQPEAFPIARDLDHARALLRSGCRFCGSQRVLTRGLCRACYEHGTRWRTPAPQPGGMHWRLQNGITTVDQERERLTSQIVSNFGIPPATISKPNGCLHVTTTRLTSPWGALVCAACGAEVPF